MLTNPEPDRNIEELNDDEIYAAIRYLELDPRSASKHSDDTATTEKNDHNGVLICGCLYIAVLGCLAVFWLYFRWGWFLASSENEIDWWILGPSQHLALAAIFGSITGALASSVSARIPQRHQDRRDIPAKRIFYRERLYSDFINENVHPLADAI
jgi:hypothetical protein